MRANLSRLTLPAPTSVSNVRRALILCCSVSSYPSVAREVFKGLIDWWDQPPLRIWRQSLGRLWAVASNWASIPAERCLSATSSAAVFRPKMTMMGTGVAR
jgi:hypothetical protein